MAQQYLDKADKALSRGGEGFYTARKALEKAGEEIVEAAQMLPRDEGMEALRIILPPLRKAQKPAEKASTKLAAIGETQRAIEKFLTTTMQLKHGGQTHGSLVFEKVDFPALESEGIQRHKAEGKEHTFFIHEYVTDEAKKEYGDGEFGGNVHLFLRDKDGEQVDYIRFLNDYDDAVEFANRQNSGEIGIGRGRYAHGGKTQGYNDKLDESLGSRRGAGRSKEQSRKDRRDESEAMEKSMGRRKYAAVGTMDEGDRMMAKGGKTKKIGFDKLAEEVAEEYREKGMSKAEAEEIGKGTAAKVFRAQQARKKRKK